MAQTSMRYFDMFSSVSCRFRLVKEKIEDDVLVRNNSLIREMLIGLFLTKLAYWKRCNLFWKIF